jgi:glycosyltransferase involved in cell wall biosynthesis
MVSPDVRVVDLKARRVLASLPGLVRYLRRNRPAALISSLSHANVVATIAWRLSGSRARLLLREDNSLRAERPKGAKAEALWQMTRWAYRRADMVIGVSNGMALDIVAMTGRSGRAMFIPNPVDLARLESERTAPIDHPFLAGGDVPVVVGMGRLTGQKDFPTLLRAVTLLRAERRCRLLILGEGEERAALLELAASLGFGNDVSLPGFVARPAAYLARASVFVLSSAWEGFGNVVVEALGCGTPVVSTDCNVGPAEILEDGKWGRLVPVGDARAMADAIAATLDDPHPPDGTVRAADYAVDSIVDRYLGALGIA